MEKQEQRLTEQESLLIIQQMIQAAKQEQKDDGMGWILWGWMLFLASVLTIINLHYNWVQTFFFWNLFGAVSVVLLLITTARSFISKNKRGVRTYTADVFAKLNIGFTITLLLIIVAMNVALTPTVGFALLTGLYGFWILIYGALLNFKPSLVAAYIVWALALTAMFVPSFGWVMALHATAVLVGYIIPGYMANSAFKRDLDRQTT